MTATRPSFASRAQRYLLAGVLTLIPLWVTWIVFEFIFRQLSRLGMPWVRALARALEANYPDLARWMVAPWFQTVLAVLVTLVALYLLGWATSRVVGRRMLGLVERLLHTIPMVQTIYGGVKKLIGALQQKPDGVQRVVLIDFPSPELKTVGFVTRILRDRTTDQELAAVYVPTTPNPTSGYLEIVPVERLVSTDWTFDEAMTFIISGGAVAPDHIDYERKN